MLCQQQLFHAVCLFFAARFPPAHAVNYLQFLRSSSGHQWHLKSYFSSFNSSECLLQNVSLRSCMWMSTAYTGTHTHGDVHTHTYVISPPSLQMILKSSMFACQQDGGKKISCGGGRDFFPPSLYNDRQKYSWRKTHMQPCDSAWRVFEDQLYHWALIFKYGGEKNGLEPHVLLSASKACHMNANCALHFSFPIPCFPHITTFIAGTLRLL